MGNFARASSILALISIALPVVFKIFGGLLFVGAVLGFLGLTLGLLSRNDPDQASAGKLGMIVGLVALIAAIFLILWSTQSVVVVESVPDISSEN